MARHRDSDGGDELEVILDERGPETAPPSASRRRPTSPRRPVVLALTVVLAAAGLGVAGGWRFGAGISDRDGSGLAAGAAAEADPPSTSSTTTSTMRAPMPPTGVADDGDGQDAPLELLDRRTTRDGITVRSLRSLERIACPPNTWCPPPECLSGAGLTVQLSTDRMVGRGGSGRRAAVVAPPMYIGSWSVVGTEVDDPVLFVIARVPDGTARVELAAETGRKDVAPPVDGWAALVMRVAADPPDVSDLQVVARDGAGREVGRVGIASMGEEDEGTPFPAQCQPPAPPLPPPGEQPPDPERARAEVRAIYEQAWNQTSTRQEKLAALSDPSGVEGAMARTAATYPRATATTVVELGDIVFTSPVQAQLHFRLVYEGAPGLGNLVGGAAFLDGRWTVLRSTYCDVLARAGATCGAVGSS